MTTAQWERRLSDIVAGKDSLDSFMRDQVATLPELLASLLEPDADHEAAVLERLHLISQAVTVLHALFRKQWA